MYIYIYIYKYVYIYTHRPPYHLHIMKQNAYGEQSSWITISRGRGTTSATPTGDVEY